MKHQGLAPPPLGVLEALESGHWQARILWEIILLAWKGKMDPETGACYE